MACNENIIKNIANEVTRNCQVYINVEPEFVVYLVELMLLNPKYGKLFEKTLNRISLEYFVNVCGAMITRGGTPLNTLKIQFTMRRNYGTLQYLSDVYRQNIQDTINPLLEEILDAEPKLSDENEMKKLYRKICIYNTMFSGLGNPALIINLKESMAALQSVFSMQDCHNFCLMSKKERELRLTELMQLTAGVRLFNRDCKKGGESIPDLPTELTDAGRGCLSTLSHGLVQCMQRVNTLTSAVEDRVSIDKETGNVIVNLMPDSEITRENYQLVFELLTFNRQYEIYNRQLLQDVQTMVETSKVLVSQYKAALQDIHAAVKYKTAVPVDTVFPLFKNLWEIWRNLQVTMYLVSTVNRLMSILQMINEHTKIPFPMIEKMLKGKKMVKDEYKGVPSVADMAARNLVDFDEVSINISDISLPEVATRQVRKVSAVPDKARGFSTAEMTEKGVAFLGFCTMCLNVGALVPSDASIGVIRYKTSRYGFCCLKMAAIFNNNPERYVNEVLEYARNNPHIINLLNMMKAVVNVRENECLVIKYVPKVKVSNQDVQTEVHPIESYIEHNYTWDLWEWKKRACQWANIVNCKTHSTQTNHSHMRSEIHCQTVEPRDKALQTKKTTGMNTNTCQFFLWGLRGQLGDNQHSMNLVPPHAPPKPETKPMTIHELVEEKTPSIYSEFSSDESASRIRYIPT